MGGIFKTWHLSLYCGYASCILRIQTLWLSEQNIWNRMSIRFFLNYIQHIVEFSSKKIYIQNDSELMATILPDYPPCFNMATILNHIQHFIKWQPYWIISTLDFICNFETWQPSWIISIILKYGNHLGHCTIFHIFNVLNTL